MNNLNTIVIPIFIGSIILEVLVSSFKKTKLYNWKDTFANLTIGVTGLLVGISTRGIALSCYYFAYNYQVGVINNFAIYWFMLFILNDVVFYFFHRLGHESRFFWSAHVNHHSSEEYNFSTALRIPFMFSLYRFLFWTPLAFLGFEPIDILFMNSMCMIYQFFLHVKWVKKLGGLEYVFNTPSHHRAHHGSNQQYIDKNYGGILIIWDRIFGTFQQENENPVYGIPERLNSHNPITIVFHEFINMLKDGIETRSIIGFFTIVFGKPGYDYKKFPKKKVCLHLNRNNKINITYKKPGNRITITKLAAILLLLFYTNISVAQESGLKKVNAIYIKPLALFEPNMKGSMGVNISLTDKHTLKQSVGVLGISGKNSYGPLNGLESKTELKIIQNQYNFNNRVRQYYWGIEGVVKSQTYSYIFNYGNNFFLSSNRENARQRVAILNFKVGRQICYQNRFYMDCFIGAGLRYKNYIELNEYYLVPNLVLGVDVGLLIK